MGIYSQNGSRRPYEVSEFRDRIWIHMTYAPIFIVFSSLVPKQSYDCPRISEKILKIIGKFDRYETKQQKTKRGLYT